MVLTETERAERRREALARTRAKMTTAQKIHQQFVAGRVPQSELRSPIGAVQAGVVLLRGLQAKMTEAGLDPKDCAVHLTYVDTNFVSANTHPIELEDVQKLINFLQGQPFIMLGLIFVIADHEADKPIAGIRPFLVTQQVVGWMRDLLATAKVGIQ
jgi:hypothetical protein